MPSSRGFATAARLARLAGHVLVAALCLELCARLDDRLSFGAPFWSRYDADGVRADDADGIPRNVPGARYEKWRINPLGFRGDAVGARVPGRLRIACLGTSETFGLYEGEGGEWPARLGRLLREQHADAEVVNASVVGLSRATRQRYIERYVGPVHPDVLVLYLNVFSDASRRTWAPGPTAPRSPFSNPTTWQRLPPSRAFPKLKRLLHGLVPDGLWRRYRIWSVERAVRGAERSALGGRPPADALPEEAMRSFEEHLRSLVQDVRARGITPVLATYPTLATAENRERYRLELLEVRFYYTEYSELGMIDAAAKLNEVVRRVARELDVPLADPEAVLEKTDRMFADEVHYTDAGAERVAETVLDALQRGGLLGSAGRTSPATTGR